MLSNVFRRLGSTTADNTSLPSNDSKTLLQQNGHLQSRSPASIRRAKSLRAHGGGAANGANSNKTMNASFRRLVCPFTGLTERQKKLITLRWRDVGGDALRRMATDIFEAVFSAQPVMLRFIGLQQYVNDVDSRRWRHHPAFRVHVQRFCDMLNEVVRTLHTPALSADSLLQFGADYEVVNLRGAAQIYDAHKERHECSSCDDGDDRGQHDRRRRGGSHSHHSGADEEPIRGGRAATEKPREPRLRCDYIEEGDDSGRAASIPIRYWDALIRALGDAVRGVHALMEVATRLGSESPNHMLLCGSEPSRFVLPPSPSPTPTTIDSSNADGEEISITLPINVNINGSNVTTSAFLYPSPPESGGRLIATAIHYCAAPISRHNQMSRSFNAGCTRDNTPSSANGKIKIANGGSLLTGTASTPKLLSAYENGNNGSPSLLLTPNRSASARLLRNGARYLNGGGCQHCQNGGTNGKRDELAIEDWNLLAVYVVCQIRFGYEMERRLQRRARRLADFLIQMFEVKQIDDNEKAQHYCYDGARKSDADCADESDGRDDECASN